jgi:hypothetical protein
MANILLGKFREEINYRTTTLNGVVFYGFTKCPFDEGLDYYHMPATSARCIPYIVYKKRVFKDNTLNDYILCTLAKLFFNNHENLGKGAPTTLAELFMEWVPYWKGNHQISDIPDLETRVHARVRDLMDARQEWVDFMYDSEISNQWYSLRIEMIKDPKERREAKFKLRMGSFTDGVVKDIKESSEDYQATNLGVLPTASILVEDTDYSRSTVVKYGKDYYTSKQLNTLNKILAIQEKSPSSSIEEISKELDVGLATVYRVLKYMDGGKYLDK